MFAQTTDHIRFARQQYLKLQMQNLRGGKKSLLRVNTHKTCGFLLMSLRVRPLQSKRSSNKAARY